MVSVPIVMNGSVHIRWSSSWPFRRSGWFFPEEAPEANQNEGLPTQGRSPAFDHEVWKIVKNKEMSRNEKIQEKFLEKNWWNSRLNQQIRENLAKLEPSGTFEKTTSNI